MIEWIVDHPGIAWLAIAAILAVAELLSLDLVLLMFAVGALFAAAAMGMGVPLWLAVIIFVLISGTLLGFARPPLIERLHRGPTLSTGFQNLVGTTVLVLSPVDTRDGRVRIGAEEWSARCEHGSLEPGVEARVVRIDGATAVVEPAVPQKEI